MKLLKGFMAVAMITTALTGATYAAYDAGNQAGTTVGDLKDVGLATPKKLSITRVGIDAVLDARFNATEGHNENAKNAKAFLHGVVVGTVDRFAGGDEPTKRAAFLAALDKALATASPIELDITAAGFNPGTPITGTEAVKEAVDIFFAAIKPVVANPRIALLAEAKALGLMKAEEADELTAVLTTPGTDGALVTAADAKVDGLELGTAIAARKALHEPTGGKFKDLGLHTDPAKVAKFHEVLDEHAGTVGGGNPAHSTFHAQISELFADGVIDGDGSSDAGMLATIKALAGKVSKLEGMLAQMAGKEGQKLAVVQSGSHARVIPAEHDLGSGQYKGGLN